VQIDGEVAPMSQTEQKLFEKYVAEHKLNSEVANTLARDAQLSGFYNDALSRHNSPITLANIITNEVARELKHNTLDALKCTPPHIASLAAMIDDKTISTKIAKELFETIVKTGENPQKIVQDKGLTQISDPAIITPIIETIITKNPENVAKFQAGNKKLLGFFVGQVLKATQGKANPQVVNRLVAEQLLNALSSSAGDTGREQRRETIFQAKTNWEKDLSTLDHEDDDPGTTWNARARSSEAQLMSPRQAWRAIKKSIPTDAIISSDIGNNCAIGNAYPSFEKARKYLAPGLFGPCGYGFPAILGAKIGCPDTPVIGFAGDGAFGISMNEMTACERDDWPAITMVIFRNYQWGAEKRNTTLWYHDNFVGTELDRGVSYAKIAEGCGAKGVTVTAADELTRVLSEAVAAQKDGVTTFIEIILNQELGEPFRRDAMKTPV